MVSSSGELVVRLGGEQVEHAALVDGLADEDHVGARPQGDAGADGQRQRGAVEDDVGERGALDVALDLAAVDGERLRVAELQPRFSARRR